MVVKLQLFHSQVRHSPVDKGASLAALPRGRYHQLTNATSQEPLVTPSSSPSRYRPSSDCSRVYMRRSRRPDSEGTHLKHLRHTRDKPERLFIICNNVVELYCVLVLVSDSSRDTSPADPDSPTVVFDKKTKRCFLDIG